MIPNVPGMPGSGPRAEEFLEMDWEMFGELCRALALKVARDYKPEVVVGIARAGVIPGAVIASILQCEFHSMLISRKAGSERIRDRPAVLSAAPTDAMGRRVLLVDEITTTGDTFRLGLAAVRDIRPSEVRTASMFIRHMGFSPDYFALETDATVIFPWDRKVIEDDVLVVNPRYEDVIEG
jgi:hypoxanthine phosphoribosyltransferase